MKTFQTLILAGLGAQGLMAAEFHVALHGDDGQEGSASKPYRTISAAAKVARPGDVVTVHEGIYRERVSPPRGGESDAKRITYQAAPGEKVEIKGSEVVKNWEKVQDDTWKVVIPNAFFSGFNPYADEIHGDWFGNRGRKHHTGAVYLDGSWLTEAAGLADVLKPAGEIPLWFGQADKETTTLWAQFKGADPNRKPVEINVRRTVFYPEKPSMNYITVRGFAMRNAATPWSPPTAEQIGLIGTHWSKGWIIENNVISHSRCTGITLGKYGDEWDNRAESAEGYVGTINRAVRNGWNRETIGHHLVRNNHISHCEQSGIVGSMGAAFSRITGNTIHDIHLQRLFSGAEQAGIKIHGAIDLEVRGNHVYRSGSFGLWFDWMAQGTRISGNLLHDNALEDLFVEVSHGPFLVDNNLFLSQKSLFTSSQGGAFAHNLFAGSYIRQNEHDNRMTPFHKAHSTEVAGLHDNPSGDDRYHNNLFVERWNMAGYDTVKLPVTMSGNVFLKGAKPSKVETDPLVKADFDPALNLSAGADGCSLEITFDPAWSAERTRKLVTTSLLGKATVPNLPFENPDGSPLTIDTDYFGKPRNPANPSPGPFESPGQGRLTIRVR